VLYRCIHPARFVNSRPGWKGKLASLPLHELQKELIKQKINIEEYEALQQKTTAFLFQLEETTRR
jgi:hypothetical protein